MKETPAVSVIIACYRQYALLQRTLLSLTRQSFTDFEVVLADDGSGPEMAQLAERFKGRFAHGLQHIFHDDDGFRKTIVVNRAVVAAKGDYLLFLDADCLAHRHFVARHYARRERGAVLSGRRILLGETLTQQLTDAQVESGAFEKPSFWWGKTEDGKHKRGLYLPWLFPVLKWSRKKYWAFGSNFSLHRADFLAVNGYDEDILGRGMEDINLSARFVLQGYAIHRLTYEALQYHQFHHSKPVPHDEAARQHMAHPQAPWAQNGIDKWLRDDAD